MKIKVENELPEKIERLVRCEASAYQKLLMKRVKEKMGSFGHVKVIWEFCKKMICFMSVADCSGSGHYLSFSLLVTEASLTLLIVGPINPKHCHGAA